MTSANGTPADIFRRPSAAFPCFARGALPPGEAAGTARAGLASLAFLAAGLTIALPPTAATAAERGQAARVHKAVKAPAARTIAHRRAAPTRAPRLRDAPEELLPVAATPAELAAAGIPAAPRGACLAAARRAEKVHGLPDGLLVAIALSESGLHAYALSIGGKAHYPADLASARHLLAEAPARGSVMAGCVQVNARIHARGSDWPLDPVRSADWAGGVIRRWHTETGSWAEALRRWHGGSPASTRHLLCRVQAKMAVTAPGSASLGTFACPEGPAWQAQRNGAALLEVAEAQGD